MNYEFTSMNVLVGMRLVDNVQQEEVVAVSVYPDCVPNWPQTQAIPARIILPWATT